MPQPHAVVIPFGVPDEGKGLGLGLAALVHTFVHVGNGGVAIAQLHGKKKDEPEGAPPAPVEAFVPPATWNDLARRVDSPGATQLVLTGTLEPPAGGQGAIQLLVFDPRDGRTRARVDASLDEQHAGASLVGALERLWEGVGGDIGALGGLRDLEWEPLESVLLAERCALHDPLRGGPHDRLAAMLHLGRAIGDAPDARYPVERLAALALETASGPALDPKLAAAAARALERAAADAPAHVELLEALAALELRLGQARSAERRLNAALARHKTRGRLYMLLAQALRAQGSLDAALATLDTGRAEAGPDAALATERGAVLAARGDMEGAKVAWREALASDPVMLAPFTMLGALAMRAKDAVTAQQLVDAALAASDPSHAGGAPHVEVLRRAVHLALATEADGIPRAARVARLATRIVDAVPNDAWAALALARAQVTLGDLASARARFAAIEQVAPATAAAAEAQASRAMLDDTQVEPQLQSVMRAAQTADAEELADVAARARRLAAAYSLWPAWVSAGIAEKRRGALAQARAALEAAVELAPGATAAHLELAVVLVALGHAPDAVKHAETARELEGEAPRTLRVLAHALEAASCREEARDVAARAVALDAEDADGRALLDRLSKPPPRPSWIERLGGAFRDFTRR